MVQIPPAELTLGVAGHKAAAGGGFGVRLNVQSAKGSPGRSILRGILFPLGALGKVPESDPSIRSHRDHLVAPIRPEDNFAHGEWLDGVVGWRGVPGKDEGLPAGVNVPDTDAAIDKA